jgi:preprotein translocase subunit YajC
MAPPAEGAEGNPYSGLIMLAIMFAIFYFLLIRPQQKRVKEHQEMVANLQKGADVVTNGGIIGKVTNIADDVVTLQVADNVKIKFQKSAVQQVLGAGAGEAKKGE